MVSVHHPAWSRASISGVGYVKASCLPATSACISSRVDGALPMLDCGQSQQIPDGSSAALQRQRGWRRGTCSAQRLPWVGSTPVACGRSFKGQRDLVGHWAAGIMTHLCEALPRRGLTIVLYSSPDSGHNWQFRLRMQKSASPQTVLGYQHRSSRTYQEQSVRKYTAAMTRLDHSISC